MKLTNIGNGRIVKIMPIKKKNEKSKALDENSLKNISGGKVYQKSDGNWVTDVIYNDDGKTIVHSIFENNTKKAAESVDEIVKNLLENEGHKVDRNY